MLTVYSTILMVYFVIGIFLLFVEPFKRIIPEEIDKTRGSEFANAVPQRPEVSEMKLFFFRVLLSLGAILLWPVLLPSAVNSEAHKKSLNDANDAYENTRDNSLKFARMCGAGEIFCLECGHSEDIVSFVHGLDSCTTGYQCQTCGDLTAIDNSHDSSISKVCDCGGVLSRNKALFCPKCKSMKVDYRMS
jgi:hypothetical protein